MIVDLAQEIVGAAYSTQDEMLFQTFAFGQAARNELLFFFKPESFADSTIEQASALVEMTLRKFSDFGVEVSGGLMLSGRRLEQLEIMDRHYGYINKLSRTASSMLTSEERRKLLSTFGIVNPSDCNIVGGHEFLSLMPAFDASQLNDLWFTKKSVKFRSGFYAQTYQVEGRCFVLVNGFHPDQLAHFTNPSHQVVLLLLHSDTDWKILKNELVGNTYPERATSGSLRGELYANGKAYGASSVSIATNFVHLSAGPFEAMFEIRNFLAGVAVGGFKLSETRMARLMASAGLSDEHVLKALTNPEVVIEGNPVNLFTLTEDTNSDDALAAYLQYFA